MSPLKAFSRKTAIVLGCLGLIVALTTPPVFAAQSKSKKASTADTKSEPSASNPVDLNTASEQQLIDLPGIGPALAKKIVANRPYSSPSELSKASVPERTIKKITPMVTTGSASAAAPATPTKSSKKANTAPAAAPESKPASEPAKSAKKSSSEPQATQAAGGGNGKVWVNTKSGVYHKEGDRWYGRTQEGKYMTEDEANKAGYHLDKQDKKD